MMSSSAWTGQDQNLVSTDEDVFQFLDMGWIADIKDCPEFDFNNDYVAEASTLLQPEELRSVLFSCLDDTDAPSFCPSNGMGTQTCITPLALAPTHATQLSRILPPYPTATSAALEIDKQPKCLQHQILLQQCRSMNVRQMSFHENQQLSPFASQQQDVVPPTSRKAQAASNLYYTRQNEKTASGMLGEYQTLKKRQDVSIAIPKVCPRRLIMS